MASLTNHSLRIPARIGDHSQLTRKERDLLQFLRENAGRCLSRDLLLSRVWGYREGVKSRTLDVHVQRLRRKLGPKEGARILTVFRGGYLWSPGNGTVGPTVTAAEGGDAGKESPATAESGSDENRRDME